MEPNVGPRVENSLARDWIGPFAAAIGSNDPASMRGDGDLPERFSDRVSGAELGRSPAESRSASPRLLSTAGMG